MKWSRRAALGVVLCAALWGWGGCQWKNTRPTPQTNPCAENEHNAQLKEAERLKDQLQVQLADSRAETESLQTQIRRSQIELLEKDARIQQLDARIAGLQQEMDEAVVEVVRAKAKLRSIESRAEAASTMAETEIALKGLKENKILETNGAEELFAKADSLLRMSADEFKRENYGGALYLAGQAKAQIKAIQSNRIHDEGADSATGEVIFRPPLALYLLKRSNLRKAPGLGSEILRILDQGMPVTGYSHKDDWIRIVLEDGESGWIHQSLIRGR